MWWQSKERLTGLYTHTQTSIHTPAHICSSASLLETVTCLAGSVTWADGTAQLGPPNLSINLLHATRRTSLFLLNPRPPPLCIPAPCFLSTGLYSHIAQTISVFLKSAFCFVACFASLQFFCHFLQTLLFCHVFLPSWSLHTSFNSPPPPPFCDPFLPSLLACLTTGLNATIHCRQ